MVRLLRVGGRYNLLNDQETKGILKEKITKPLISRRKGGRGVPTLVVKPLKTLFVCVVRNLI